MPIELIAPWYVPSIPSGDLRNLPEGVNVTLFNPENHGGNLSSGRLQREYEISSRAIGESLLNFSPERLALHETIVGISTQIRVNDENHFVTAFKDIYYNHVLPMVAAHKAEFGVREENIKEASRKLVADYVQTGLLDTNNPMAARILAVSK